MYAIPGIPEGCLNDLDFNCDIQNKLNETKFSHGDLKNELKQSASGIERVENNDFIIGIRYEKFA